MTRTLYKSAAPFALIAGLALTVSACQTTASDQDMSAGAQAQDAAFAMPAGFSPWAPVTDDYRLFAGDEVDIVVYTAPELSRTLTVAPDGRLIMPYADPVMASGRTIKEAEAALSAALAKTLKNPDVRITPNTFSSQQVFVGGEVQSAGVYDIPGPIDPLQAIILAGGATIGAKTSNIALIRSGPDGRPMMKTININTARKNPEMLKDIQIQRFDIVYVPRNGLAEVAAFMTNLRNALPVNFAVSYAINDPYSN